MKINPTQIWYDEFNIYFLFKKNIYIFIDLLL